jgi:hypothetical protein
MDNDDRQIGRILSRREVLALFGAAGAAILVGCGPTEGSSAGEATASGAVASPSLNLEAATAVATQVTAPIGTLPARICLLSF